MTPEQIAARDTAFYGRLSDERQRLLAKLLHAIARVLNFKAEQLEIFEGGYTPQGWFDVELENMAVRRLFAEISAGRRVPIGVLDYTRVEDLVSSARRMQDASSGDNQKDADTGR